MQKAATGQQHYGTKECVLQMPRVLKRQRDLALEFALLAERLYKCVDQHPD